MYYLALFLFVGLAMAGDYDESSAGDYDEPSDLSFPFTSSGWARKYQQGYQTTDCKTDYVSGSWHFWSDTFPQLKFYSAGFSVIKSVMAYQPGGAPSQYYTGLVKLIAGGVQDRFVVLSFKSGVQNRGYRFHVRICW